MFTLDGKKALVCGSTRGIGRACAEAFARAGATVTLVARDENALQKLAASLDNQTGRTHACVAVDFADPPALQSTLEAHLQVAGHFHILLNNTGGPPGGPITEADATEFEQAFARHLICNHLLTRTLLPGMKQFHYGRIINVVSTSVRQPIPGLGVSNTVRAAVAGWAKTLAGELAPFGITVNNILPGYTATDRLASIIRARAERSGVSETTIQQQMQSEVPAGRFARPEEIAAAAVFLASPEAGYITGVSLPVDGGRISAL